MTLHPKFLALSLPLALLAGCNGATSGDGTDNGPGTGSGGNVSPDEPLEPGAKVTLSLGSASLEQKSDLDRQLAQVADLNAAEFGSQTQVNFESLSYDPSTAEGLALIKNSQVGLTAKEEAMIADKGFVVTKRKTFPTFSYGYSALYGEHLPLFVSADSILFALHRSYDNILKDFESQSLLPELQSLMAGMRAQLKDSGYKDTLASDLDVYLTVAASLLKGEQLSPHESSNATLVTSLFKGCTRAEGAQAVEIFGAHRNVDFSQCQPRGHYTDSPELKRYFRAMMWLGRIDFRMIETQSDGSSLFHRRQLEAAWALRDMLTAPLRQSHEDIDAFITAFVGEHDYMTVDQFDQLATDLGVSDVEGLSGISDQTIAQAIVDGGYGTQRISSHYMVNGMGSGTLPLSSSFAFFGQRYVIDSHVFSNVVFDRAAGGSVKRMMPDPLDAAYAALGNDQAGMLLKDELDTYAYASDLQSMRVIADSEPPSFWNMNLYNRWLGALRTLSPSEAMAEGPDEALPEIAKTEAWGTRLLNTQLASWAELRHDTILYVKQSYTSGVTCDFPDAYVDPYPAFFAAIQSYAEHAGSLIGEIGFPPPSGTVEHFDNFAQVAGTLREMAEHQRTGTPHSEEHLAFINETVTVEELCGGATANGWYPNLVYGNSVEFDPTIADVHTQPQDENGADVGRILHVGTGDVRLMVTTINTCSGPRAYAGLVSSYFEHVEENWNRLTDPEWAEKLWSTAPPESPEWIQPVIVQD